MIKPIGDRVLVQPLEEQEVKKGGIIIPDTAKEKPQEGKVVAIGTGKTDDNGKKIPFEVKKGDKVLISKYGGTEVKIDGENYLIMRGDTDLADRYGLEILRFNEHYRFRYFAKLLKLEKARPLAVDDSWADGYFKNGSLKRLERLRFAGR